MRAGADRVRRRVVGPPRALGIERLPPRAVQPGDRARTTVLRGGKRGRGDALHVLREIVQRADHLPVEAAPAPRRGQRMAPMAFPVIIDAARKGAGGDRIGATVDVEGARIGRCAGGGIRQITVGMCLRIVQEQSADIGQPDRGRQVDRRLQLDMILPLMFEPARPQHADRHPQAVQIGIATGGGRSRGAGGRRLGRGDVEQRLAVAGDVIHAGEQRNRPEPVADRRAQLICGQGFVRRILVELLDVGARSDRALQPIGQPCRDVDDRADRIARIGRRERPVEHVDPRDLLRADQAPARAGDRVVVADQRRQQRAIRIDQAARARSETRGTRRERCLGIADMALPDDERGKVFQRLFDVERVDRGRDHVAGDGRGAVGCVVDFLRLSPCDDQDIVLLPGWGRSLRGCGQGARDDRETGRRGGQSDKVRHDTPGLARPLAARVVVRPQGRVEECRQGSTGTRTAAYRSVRRRSGGPRSGGRTWPASRKRIAVAATRPATRISASAIAS